MSLLSHAQGDRSRRRDPDGAIRVGHEADLVGRQRELDELAVAVRRCRLVTVTGPGGVGKTRLALAASRPPAMVGDRTRVVVCELADVEDPASVRHAVAGRLEVLLHPGEPVGASLPAPVDGSALLVVLDNCEHVLDAAADVADELLASGDHVRVLATSREPLRLPGEQVLPLRPLPVPGRVDDPGAADSPSVVLFAQHARMASPEFVLDEHTLPDVVRLCRSLDGLPLALELASARVRTLSVGDIADRLDHRFTLLRSGTRRLPDRHQSLRAVLDWSYGLLDSDERNVLTALAVFPAGCDLPAGLSAAAGVGLAEDAAIDVLDRLVGRSLVTVSRHRGRTRWSMLESVREYAIEHLKATGGLAAARDRHADHYAALAGRIRAEALRSWADAPLLPVLLDIDNIRVAVGWTLAHDDLPDRTFALLAPLWYLCQQQGEEEIVDFAERALARWPKPDHPLWSEVAGTAAEALVSLEDPRAQRRGEQAIEAATSPVGVAYGQRALAQVATFAYDDPLAGLAHLDSADSAAAAAGYEPLKCDLLSQRAQVLMQAGRLEEALATARRAVHLARAQNNLVEHAWARHLLGLLLLTDGRPDAAHEWAQAALVEARETGYPFNTASATRALAAVAAARGDIGTSADLFSDALDRFVRAGCRVSLGTTVAASLPLLVRAGRRDAAATLLAGLDARGLPLERVHAPMLDSVREDLTRKRPDAACTARGEALSLDEIFLLARREVGGLRRTGAGATAIADAQPRPVALEVDVAAELRRVGDLWQMTYAGSVVHVPDLKGIADLATLLARPGREVAALDLAVPAGDRSPAGDFAARADQLGSPGDLGERVDAQARAAFTARIGELQADLDEADAAGDAERGTAAQQELDFLTRELSAAYGLHGPRRAGDPTERARAAVTARIRAAIAKIRDAHPALGAHLDSSVRTGRFCAYQPNPPLTWRVVGL